MSAASRLLGPGSCHCEWTGVDGGGRGWSFSLSGRSVVAVASKQDCRNKHISAGCHWNCTERRLVAAAPPVESISVECESFTPQSAACCSATVCTVVWRGWIWKWLSSSVFQIQITEERSYSSTVPNPRCRDRCLSVGHLVLGHSGTQWKMSFSFT